MSLFKEKRLMLLAVASLLALAIVWQPWRGLSPELRGLTYGIDIAGGSRVTLKLEACEATIKMREPISGDLQNVDQLASAIADNLLTSVRVIAVDRAKNEATLEIGRPVESGALAGIIGGIGEVVDVENRISSEARDEVVDLLLARVDPAGLLGVQARPAGANLVLFEIPAMDPERARALLERQGRLEAFIEDTPVLRGADIERVFPVRVYESRGVFKYEVPLRISQEGAERFAAASKGKGDYPLVIYLDRPEDAVLLFDRVILGRLQTGYTYDDNRRMFHATIDTYWYHLLVTSLPIDAAEITENTRQILEGLRVLKNRAILLGTAADYSENVVATVKSLFTENMVTFFPRAAKDTETEWIIRACGLQSAPAISPEIAGKAARDVEITGTRGSYESAEEEAKDLRTILSQRLPIRVSFVGAISIPARLGGELALEVKKAALAAVIAVGVLVYLRYRHPLIVGAIMLTMGCEMLITLGAASAIRQTIGLAEIGGLLAVIGTGVEHRLIITDEVLRGEISLARPRGVMGRVGRAFSIIFAAAATTIAAMVALALVGFGAMKGFAIITSMGILIAVFVTRPAYGRIINAIVARQAPKAEQAARLAQQ